MRFGLAVAAVVGRRGIQVSMSWRWFSRWVAAVLAVAAAQACPVVAGPAGAQQDRVYTVGNYPVEAHAQDAVAAKEKALADGQQAAFRSLLKRLTPVASYKALANVKGVQAGNMIRGIAVRSERNSTTSYRASLDFSFDADRVRDVLRQRAIVFVDEPARETAIVLVVQPTGAQAAAGSGVGPFTAKTWREAWSGLDLENGLTPVKLHDRPEGLSPDIIKASLSNPEASLRTIAVLAKSGQALLALAEPDVAARRLHVTLSGTDGVGPIVLRRTWRMDPADAAYAAELASVVALGIIEGRWKAVRVRPAAAVAAAGAPLQPVQLVVEFRTNQEWQSLQRQLAEVPGVSDFSVGGISARSADVALRYPGGGQALAAALAGGGVDLRGSGGAWYARTAN
jgi:hypothetical protein